MDLRLLPRRLAYGLTAIAVLLIIVSFALQITFGDSKSSNVIKFVRMFYVDVEGNIPSWFSVVLLFGAALLFIVIGMYRRHHFLKDNTGWLLMGALFTYLSLDEGAELHEKLIGPMRSLLGAGGILYFAWIIPGIIVLLILAWYFRPFVTHLPGKIRRGFLVAVVIYLVGALGSEMVGGLLYQNLGQDNPLYYVQSHIEELLEMTAVILLIYILLTEAILLIPGIDTSNESVLSSENAKRSEA
jgi:hypothetical protein